MVTSPLHPHVTLRSTYKEVIVFFEVPWTAGLNMEIIQSMVLPSGTAAVFFVFFFQWSLCLCKDSRFKLLSGTFHEDGALYGFLNKL